MDNGLTNTNIVLSNLGTRIFFTDANMKWSSTPTTPENMTEAQDAIDANNLGFSRNSKDYNPLASGGWGKSAITTFETNEMTINFVRSEQGAYNKDSTYWFCNDKAEQTKVGRAYFGLIIVRPVAGASDDDLYEARYWTVWCSGIDDNVSGDSGREYAVTFKRSGKHTDLTVSVTTGEDGTETFKFAKKGATTGA